MEMKPELAALGLVETNMLTSEEELTQYSEYTFITESIKNYGEILTTDNVYDISNCINNILFRSSREENLLYKVENLSKFLFRIPAIAEQISEITTEKRRLAAATTPFKIFNQEEFKNEVFSIKLRYAHNTFFINIKKDNVDYSGILKFIIRIGSKESNVIFNIKNGTAQIPLLNENEVISNSLAEFWVAID